jgi:DNA-directed RNA polymerase specialized sigma24 family protein
MGLPLFPGNRQTARQLQSGIDQERFGAYFPRVFAYTFHQAGNEAAAARIVSEAFAAVFARQPGAGEDEFRLALFGVARDLCRRSAAVPGGDERLSEREREIISLLFDAQLTRREAATILGLPEESITNELVRALKKMRGSASDTVIPSFLRLT